MRTNFTWHDAHIVARLKAGVTLEQARQSMAALSLKVTAKDFRGPHSVIVVPMREEIAGKTQNALILLLCASVALLLIACVNLANLLLAQSATREKEMSIRAAMGAGRSRLVRQLLTESVLLALAGGAAGLLVADWGRTALWSFRPPFLNNASIDLSFEPRVLLFTAGISLLTGILFGLAPAIHASRANLNDALKAGGRSGSATTNRTRSALVVSEIGLATMALIGAGLFVRSMQAVQQMDLGFDSTHTAVLALSPGQQRLDQAHGLQYYEDAVSAARQVPGVEAATVSSSPPLQGGLLLTVYPEGEAQNPNARGLLVTFNDIEPGYFDTLRIPLRSGRNFTEFDRPESAEVAIVNDAFAKQLWPGQDALHKRFTIVQRPTLYEIVGVAANAVVNQVGEDPTPMIYRPLRQDYAAAAALVVRTSGDPEKMIGAIRDRVQALDRRAPLRGIGTVQQQIQAGLWAPRMGAALLSIFGGLALVLAMIGVYGVMSYTVTQRVQEIGIRMALGAGTSDVLVLVLRQGMTLAIAGAAVGIALALLGGRLVSTLLFGVSGRDPLTLAAVSGALTLVALVACYIPARRASRVDPLIALRYE